VSTQTDLAAGRLIDSLFEPEPPSDLLPGAPGRDAAAQSARPAQTTAWSGRLVRNPKPADGRPAYVIIDRYGGIKRYVEPTKRISLEPYVGQKVTVRRDTGDTLLASQLLLPRLNRSRQDPSSGNLRLAAHDEEMPAGELVPTPADGTPLEEAPVELESLPMEGEMYEGEVYEGEMYYDEDPLHLPGGGYSDGIDFGGCPQCGSQVCAGSACGFGSRPIFYARGQYLLWWMDGMDTPPLVAQDTGDSDFQNPATTSIIYGGDKVLEDVRNGGRVLMGYWLDDYGNWAVEGDYLGLESLSDRFVAGEKDSQAPLFDIGRPFINVFDTDLGNTTLPRGRAIEEVDTDNIDGTVTVDIDSEFQSAGLRIRRGLCCSSACGTDCGDCVTCGSGFGGGCDGCGAGVAGWGGLLPNVGVRRIDALFGVRWAQLDEGLRVTEDLASPQGTTAPTTTFLLNDRFLTSNEFLGGELGFVWEWEHRRWSLELLSKIALGNTRQRVDISGSTLRDAGMQTEALQQGGLLALPSNIGTYTRDQFSVLPELGVTMGYLLTDRLRLSVGYSFLYWSNVVRPGDQVDNIIDVTQVPQFGGAPNPVNPAVVPRFVFREKGLWVQGLDLGMEYRW
jgi:hypothetical protein